jgi:hypothetical protein
VEEVGEIVDLIRAKRERRHGAPAGREEWREQFTVLIVEDHR